MAQGTIEVDDERAETIFDFVVLVVSGIVTAIVLIYLAWALLGLLG